MASISAGGSLGRYRVVEQLGRGGMATVYRCYDPTLDRFVAVKVLPSYMTDDPAFIGRFTREAQTVASLKHPNILQIYDFGEDKGFTYIVSELVPGGDLQDKMRDRRFELKEVLDIVRPLADALDHAHQQRIIHRDLKPANVLLDADERPILADFGLARMLESSTRFTQDSQALGTPEYMAPEQAMGADADHRSDLYALAIMVYQMLLGQTPFRADTPAATLMAHVHRPLPLPTALDPNIEPKLEATLLKCLAKNPDDRFQSAGDMVAALALAGGLQTDQLPGGSADTTAVMDLGKQRTIDDTEAPTAVVDSPSPARSGPAGSEAAAVVVTPAPEAASPRQVGGRAWLLAGGAAVVLVVVAATVVPLVLAGGGEEPGPAEAGPVAEPTPALTAGQLLEELNKTIATAEANVIELRGGSPDEGIEIEFKSRDTLASITRGFFRRDYLRQQIFEAEELYKALDLMSEEQDLEDILYDIQLQQVRALFDEQSEKIYVLSDVTSVGPLEELGTASAFMASIQQAQFDTAELRNRARDAGSDQDRALAALIQGDVAQVMSGYVTSYLTREEAAVLAEPLPENKLLEAPRVVRQANLFPQQEGFDFVAALFGTDEGGWDAVNAAYLNPPVSTEQVIHPDKYSADEKPQRTDVPLIVDKLGKGWTQVSSDTMGEFIIRTYLEEHLDRTQAAAAAAGWGGDGYSLMSGPEGQRLLLSLIRWDTFQDSKEFFDAYQVFAGIKTQGSDVQTARLGDTGRTWSTPDEIIFLGQTGPSTILIIGDEREAVDLALQLLFESLSEPVP